ncbi:WXG100 family type VII secretion target [Streptomyces sp. NPDC004684]
MGESQSPKGARDLRAKREDLTKLADDLNDMQDYLNRQVRRMDALVDTIEAGWQGSAGSAYRAFHRAAAEDAVRIREVLELVESAVRLSRDGFTERELEVLDRLRRIEMGVAGEVDRLSTPDPAAAEPQTRPRSSLDGF